MPFTFSHPAVVLPLQFIDRKKFSVTALTIGSLTPDFEYFFRVLPISIYSHKIKGIFWFDLPISIVLFFLYTVLVKNELINNLPSFLYSRFSRFKTKPTDKYSVKNSLIILTSLLIGITSHLVWDKLTHRGAFLLVEFVESYSFLWNTSSVIGASVIAFIVLRMPRKDVGYHKKSFLFWFLILSSVLVFVTYRSFEYVEIQFLVVAAISGLFLGLLLASIVSKVIRQRR